MSESLDESNNSKSERRGFLSPEVRAEILREVLEKQKESRQSTSSQSDWQQSVERPLGSSILDKPMSVQMERNLEALARHERSVRSQPKDPLIWTLYIANRVDELTPRWQLSDGWILKAKWGPVGFKITKKF